MSNLSLKLEQKAKILQVQRLTIQMLALHAQNLADFLQEQVTDNPLLDIRYHDVRPAGDKGDKAIDNLRSRSDSLEARLMAQLRVQSLPRPQLMAAGLVICLAVPDVLMGWFTSREETIAAGASALGIIAWGFVPSALSITASGALEGLGKGNPSFAITLLRYVVISLPAAWLLCRVYGPDGVWHAFWIFECLAALAAWKIYDHYAPAVTKEKETT